MAEIKMNPPGNRLVGEMPKIGIRPTIDGRWEGVRESLEDQTMAMAQTAARLLEENLRHPNGLPVECVIADTLHRRRGRSRPDRREIRPRGRGRLPHRHPLPGAMAPRRWTWTPTCPRPSGALTAPSARARSTWPPCWPRTTRRACPPLASMGATCRMRATRPSPRTSRKSCSSSPGPDWPWPACAASPTSRWAASRWASPARSSIPASLRATWACASSRWT